MNLEGFESTCGISRADEEDTNIIPWQQIQNSILFNSSVFKSEIDPLSMPIFHSPSPTMEAPNKEQRPILGSTTTHSGPRTSGDLDPLITGCKEAPANRVLTASGNSSANYSFSQEKELEVMRGRLLQRDSLGQLSASQKTRDRSTSSENSTSSLESKKGRKRPRPKEGVTPHRLIEKRRRDRINHSLEELKALVLPTERALKNKTDKADVLRIAIEHIKELQSMNKENIGLSRNELLTADDNVSSSTAALSHDGIQRQNDLPQAPVGDSSPANSWLTTLLPSLQRGASDNSPRSQELGDVKQESFSPSSLLCNAELLPKKDHPSASITHSEQVHSLSESDRKGQFATLAGFEDCRQACLQYLKSVEGLSDQDPLVERLSQHLRQQQAYRLDVESQQPVQPPAHTPNKTTPESKRSRIQGSLMPSSASKFASICDLLMEDDMRALESGLIGSEDFAGFPVDPVTTLVASAYLNAVSTSHIQTSSPILSNISPSSLHGFVSHPSQGYTPTMCSPLYPLSPYGGPASGVLGLSSSPSTQPHTSLPPFPSIFCPPGGTLIPFQSPEHERRVRLANTLFHNSPRGIAPRPIIGFGGNSYEAFQNQQAPINFLQSNSIQPTKLNSGRGKCLAAKKQSQSLRRLFSKEK